MLRKAEEEEEEISLAPVGTGVKTLETQKRSPTIVHSGAMTTGRMRHGSLDHLQQTQQSQQPPGEWMRTIETRTVKSRGGTLTPLGVETRTEHLKPPGGAPGRCMAWWRRMHVVHNGHPANTQCHQHPVLVNVTQSESLFNAYGFGNA